MSHKKNKKINKNKGYNQNQQANDHFGEAGLSEKYKENSNAQE